MHKVAYNRLVIGCLSTFIVTLGGCGGGGGGGTITDIAPPMPTTTTKTENGISQEADYTASGTVVTSVTDQIANKTGSSVSITTNDADGVIQKVAITTPNGLVTWDTNNGDMIDTSGAVIAVTNPSSLGVVINKDNPSVPWQYQTFGIWETGLDTNTGRIGSISVGESTTGSNIPLTGTVDFDGVSGGIYIDPVGKTYITASDLYARVDFGQRTIAMETVGTGKIDAVTGDIGSGNYPVDLSLDMQGTLRYSAGLNSFTGTVSAPGMTGTVSTPGMSGTSTGQFYGPAAQELGGVFSLQGAGVETYQGAYGAVQIK